MKKLIIKWSIKQLIKIYNTPNTSYAELDKYGVADIMKSDLGEPMFIFNNTIPKRLLNEQ